MSSKLKAYEEKLNKELDKATWDGQKVPPQLHTQIINWVLYGEEAGHFIMAVARNDLHGAINYGDTSSLEALRPIVGFFYCHCPSNCWGSREVVKEWAEDGGIQRAL